ncbi:MAG: phenylalanine--tRNA ligase subunit alpha [Elusimicrobia bacterium]|nr:phenylalanine--tRNA ligase subunit alpha [Elusimicrobiota bacterium]
MPASWEKNLRSIQAFYTKALREAKDPKNLETLRVEVLGRKGKLTLLLKDLKNCSLEERKRLGPLANQLKDQLESLIQEKRENLTAADLKAKLETPSLFDPSLPGASFRQGHSHPLTQTMNQMTEILAQQGFSWAEGPLIESDYYNFEALNFLPDHPARDMQDTFYISSKFEVRSSKLKEEDQQPRTSHLEPRTGLLLRTHTSPVQIRKMESSRPPLRIMAPGRVFRHEAVDASHSAVFHQIEGLYVDRQVSMADLKGTLQIFMQSLFGSSTEIRFRPSYFPFTEPSAEVDVQCLFCQGGGCTVCKKSGWLEMLGAGLVHPNVLKQVGYDPETWSGFAFGIGVERVTMLLLGIQDIRMFYENDVRFLEQF